MCLGLHYSIQAQLPEDAKISLLTVAHGDQLYNTFGHTAIRITDNDNGIDLVYNYGTFNTSTDNFMWKFLRGRLQYTLAVDTFEKFLLQYNYEKRKVIEQSLDLDQKSKNRIYSFIKNNYKEENRFYLYDFFFDNCATRIRDIFETELDAHQYKQQATRQVTYRQLLDEYLQGLDWTDFGIDLIIGSVADQIADHRGQQFLPDYLYNWTELSSYSKGTGAITSLVDSEHPVLALDIIRHRSYPITPIICFTIFLLIEMLLFIKAGNISRRLQYWYDLVWYLLFSISCLTIAFMWFFTDHDACANNYNFMWANPFFIGILFTHFNNADNRKLMFLANILMVLTLLLWSIIPQQFHLAIIPIIIIGILKNLRNHKHLVTKTGHV